MPCNTDFEGHKTVVAASKNLSRHHGIKELSLPLGLCPFALGALKICDLRSELEAMLFDSLQAETFTIEKLWETIT